MDLWFNNILDSDEQKIVNLKLCHKQYIQKYISKRKHRMANTTEKKKDM